MRWARTSRALGLLFSSGGNLMGERFANGAFVARHGSWNRKPLAGYDVVFVPFDANGNPQGMPQPVLTGFLDRKGQRGARPPGLAGLGQGRRAAGQRRYRRDDLAGAGAGRKAVGRAQAGGHRAHAAAAACSKGDPERAGPDGSGYGIETDMPAERSMAARSA